MLVLQVGDFSAAPFWACEEQHVDSSFVAYESRDSQGWESLRYSHREKVLSLEMLMMKRLELPLPWRVAKSHRIKSRSFPLAVSRFDYIIIPLGWQLNYLL